MTFLAARAIQKEDLELSRSEKQKTRRLGVFSERESGKTKIGCFLGAGIRQNKD